MFLVVSLFFFGVVSFLGFHVLCFFFFVCVFFLSFFFSSWREKREMFFLNKEEDY